MGAGEAPWGTQAWIVPWGYEERGGKVAESVPASVNKRPTSLGRGKPRRVDMDRGKKAAMRSSESERVACHGKDQSPGDHPTAVVKVNRWSGSRTRMGRGSVGPRDLGGKLPWKPKSLWFFGKETLKVKEAEGGEGFKNKVWLER